MSTLITNPSISDPVTLPAGFFAEEVGPREGIVVSDSEAAVTAALVGLSLTVQTLDTGTGDVVGPGSSTDDALVRWDGATGLLVKDSNANVVVVRGDNHAWSNRGTEPCQIAFILIGSNPPTKHWHEEAEKAHK